MKGSLQGHQHFLQYSVGQRPIWGGEDCYGVLQVIQCGSLCVSRPAYLQSGSISDLSGEVTLCFCLAGVLVEGLEVPEEDALCGMSVRGCLWDPERPLADTAAWCSSGFTCASSPFFCDPRTVKKLFIFWGFCEFFHCLGIPCGCSGIWRVGGGCFGPGWCWWAQMDYDSLRQPTRAPSSGILELSRHAPPNPFWSYLE